eukprot:103688_1
MSLAMWLLSYDLNNTGKDFRDTLYIHLGFVNIVCYYFIPHMLNMHWFAIVTYLQHIDGDMQRFKPCEWLWLRGVFETVDRDFGFFLDYVFHRVTSSHVIHHLFPTMPHYNAIKATKYLKASKFKKYYSTRNQRKHGMNRIGS